MSRTALTSYRVLAADDEQYALDLYQDVLSPEGSLQSSGPVTKGLSPTLYDGDALDASFPSFEVTLCHHGPEAVETVRTALAEGRPFALAFLDIRMPPGPDGIWTAEQIRVLDPDTEIVIVTAYSDIDPQNIADRLLPPDKLLYLLKPLHPPEIRQFASALGAKWSAERQLRDIQAGLAIQVQERTAELEKTNEQLKREIAERTRAEEELKHTLGRLRKAMDGAIHAMALTVEVRDPYTSGHQRRVANLARAIATEMGLSAVQIDGIRFAGIIHDIGKISVPSEILSKPGQLSETEFNLIKIHSQVGYDILRKIEFDWPVADIVYQHHERMDGSGYPLGLSGESILIEARTISVADVVEAMASYRPYRPMLGIDKALEEISQKKGSLYDPLVVEACLRVFEKRAFKFE